MNLLTPCLNNNLSYYMNTGSNSEYGFSKNEKKKFIKPKQLLWSL